MVGHDLHSGPDDERHQEQVEEVLPADPGRHSRWTVRLGCSGVLLDEGLHRRQAAQLFGQRDTGDQEQEADRQQPQQVEPSGPAHPHPWCDTRLGRNGAGPGGGVDDVLALGQLRP